MLEQILKEFDEQFPCIQSECDNNGTFPSQGSNGECEPNPCQYCYEQRLPAKDFLKTSLKSFARTIVEQSVPEECKCLENAIGECQHNKIRSQTLSNADNLLK